MFSEWLEYVRMEANVKKCIYIRSEADGEHVARTTVGKMGRKDECDGIEREEEVTVENILRKM